MLGFYPVITHLKSKLVFMSLGLSISFLLIYSHTVFAADSGPQKKLLLTDESISQWQVSVDKQSAHPVWKQLSGIDTFLPVLSDQQLLVGSSAGLYSINRQDGQVNWQVAPNETIFSPVLMHDTVFAASKSGFLRALDLHTGVELWQSQFTGWIYTPALSENTLVTGGSDATVWGVDATSGMTQWQHKISAQLVIAPIALGNNHVAISDFNNNLQMLDSKDGALLWQAKVAAPATQLIKNKNTLYSSEYDGTIQAFDTRTGKELWRYQSHSDFNQRLQISTDGLLVINELGYQKLNYTTGTLMGRYFIDGEPIGLVQQINSDFWGFYRKAGKPTPIKFKL